VRANSIKNKVLLVLNNKENRKENNHRVRNGKKESMSNFKIYYSKASQYQMKRSGQY
jgi:hypothetical protein